MAARSNPASDAAPRELVITRVFDAPRHLVFKAWTEPERLMRWWGPHGCTTTSCKLDVRVDGSWRICMRLPNGIEVWQQGAYREIVEPERLVFTYAFEDAAGKPGHQTLVTVTFADDRGKTRLTVHQAIFESVEVRNDHVRGWNEALDHLVTQLARDKASAIDTH